MATEKENKEVPEVAVIGQDTNHLFPVFLRLEILEVLLVGAGNVGLEKLTAILGNAPAAHVSVVAAKISEQVRELAAGHAHVTIQERAFEEADLDGKDLVIIAVNDQAVSQSIRDAARTRKILVNAADKPDQCDFYLSSVVQKGNLKIAISTNGKSPTAAKRIKEVLNKALPGELNEVINNLHVVRNRLNGNFEYKVKRLNELTKILIERDTAEKERRWRKIATYSLIIFALMLVGHFIFSYLPIQQMADDTVKWYQTLDKNFHWMVLAGFLAQLVDGALGMGYGVTSATILLSAGVNLAAISGSIHTAEMFASGASGYSHYKFGNVNKKLFKILVIPGVIGAILGAVLLSLYGDTHTPYLRPIMACYTMFLGLRIFYNAFKKQQQKPKKFKRYGLLAGAGGFLDSFGGGGWGPIVTTTLITKGRSPRFVIGSVSLTEFFVTLASAFTFFTLLGVTHWQVIVALIIGGLLAAPIAAKLTGKLPRKTSLILLGLLVMFWSIKIIIKIF
ncbi:TSUP family transporter [Pseudoflavitalea sp. X16]|uniref:TSUP family transporter n=1 Tax=Paraflavitalea devenefica TaxID=2716334 RepID=UPI001420B72B|nr:TSUP family transporter [Paraflavitalea devenefica]NII25047.1 TSUP family transporter [Paraflavitalea devenefica]